MDELLSEKEQLEQIRVWWREYGWYLAGGVALGAAILFGMRQFDTYNQIQAESAAAVYQELRLAIGDDADTEALGLVEQLRADYPSSPYTDQAGMLIVLMHLQNQSTRLAIEALRYTLETTSDEHLSMIARTRLARLMVSADRHDEAMEVLAGFEAGSFAARFSEIRGDIYYARGDSDSARTAYNQALNSEQSDLVDRALIQMKLDDLAAPVASVVEEDVLSEDAGG